MPPKSKAASKRKINQNLIKVQDRDALLEDPPIKGQNFALVSFLEPDELIKNKETFMFEHFMKSIVGDLGDILKFLENKYKDDKGIFTTIKERYSYLINNDLHEQYVYFKKNADDLEDQYYKLNDFQPTRRGFKIRGNYDSIPECQARCKQLRVIDPHHNIHILQVGAWCLFNPNEDDIENQEYSYDELNTLMHKYNENRQHAKEYFEERKDDMMKEIEKENEDKKKKAELEAHQKVMEIEDNGENEIIGVDAGTGETKEVDSDYVKIAEPTPELMSGLEMDDPWLQRKKEHEKQE